LGEANYLLILVVDNRVSLLLSPHHIVDYIATH